MEDWLLGCCCSGFAFGKILPYISDLYLQPALPVKLLPNLKLEKAELTDEGEVLKFCLNFD